MTDLAVIKILEGNAAVSALVSERIYASYIPQNIEPPLVLTIPTNIDRGVTKDNDQREEITIDIISVGSALKACKTLDIKVYNAMHHYGGPAITLSSGEVIKIVHSYHIATRSEFNTEIGWHTIVSSYRIFADVNL